MEEKQKRQLTPEQLENLKKGREKARLLNIQKKEIADVKKEAKKEKTQKINEEYERVIEEKKKKAAQPPPKEEPEEESEEEPEEEPPLPPPQPFKRRAKPVAQAPPPPPPPPPVVVAKPRQRAPPKPRAKSDDELYGEASISILKKKLQQETRQRLMTDLFNY